MAHADESRMRIAIIAPPWFEVPPRAYGGIEAVCGDLVNQLVYRGHDVTLIAAGKHRTAGRFIQTLPEPPSARLGEPLPELLHAALAARAVETLDIDVLHDHTLTGLLLAGTRPLSTVVTAHGPVQGEIAEYYRALDGRIALVAISDGQRRTAPDLPWIGTVSNGINPDDYPFRVDKENDVLWLGRFSAERARTSPSTPPGPPGGRYCSPASAMIPSVVEREILVRAPLETVCSAVSDPDQLGRWFSDAAESGFLALERPEEEKAKSAKVHAKGWDIHLANLRDHVAGRR